MEHATREDSENPSAVANSSKPCEYTAETQPAEEATQTFSPVLKETSTSLLAPLQLPTHPTPLNESQPQEQASSLPELQVSQLLGKRSISDVVTYAHDLEFLEIIN